MKLLRLRIATALLRGAGIVAGVIAGPGLTGRYGHDGHTPKVYVSRIHPAGSILLASFTGLAICFVWIWINGRAWQ
jgi:hypothetical protein